MKRKHLIIILAIVALVIASIGNAWAMYMSDGAVPNGSLTNAANAGWNLSNDGICVLGLSAAGNMTVATTTTTGIPSLTTSRDCAYYNYGLTTIPMTTVASGYGSAPSNVTTSYGTYGACTNKRYTWDFVHSTCWNVNGCTGTNSATGGTLTFNPADDTCYDSAPCTVAGAANNDGSKHKLATSICVDSNGNGISLKDMDRTFAMCAAKGGTWKQTTNTTIVSGSGATATATVQVPATAGFGGACVAYGWQYRGVNATGNPLAFNGKGTSNTTAGFCYATIDTGATSAANCPSVVGSSAGTKTASSSAAFGYSAGTSAPFCTYSYGIQGKTTANIYTANGTLVSSGTNVNFGQWTTMGDCLNNGGSWSNWTPLGTTGTDPVGGTATIMTFNLTGEGVQRAVSADDGCLHCHSSLDQANGPVNRQKDSYVMTGHKNMLRKVTAGQAWAGPNAAGVETVYTIDSKSIPINWSTGMYGTNALYYIYGYVGASPAISDAVIAGSAYSCAPCHTAGFSGGTASTPGVQSIGTPGYVGVQPPSPYSTGVKAGLKWDLEGIQCARCHNATVPTVTAAQITASTFLTTAPTSGGMGALAAGTGRTNLCFGCHFSAPTLPASTVGNPTYLPVGSHSGYAASFAGSGPYGNQFLNSPHARYTGATSGAGSITANSLGEYDLTDPNGTSEYNSIFKGYDCFQSSTSTSVATTLSVSGGVVTKITNKSQCESLYGTGSWRADDGSLGTTQGTCTTCHDVHNSVYVASEEAAAIRKTCADCHVSNATTNATDANAPQVTTINHPQTAGTPSDTALYGDDACSVCHMGNAKGTMAHVWRINTNANYSTFPTAAQWATNKNSNTASETYTTGTGGTYANAVWVDMDMACGQCHGGSAGSGATVNSAPYMSKSALAGYAVAMHNAGQSISSVQADFMWTQDTSVSKQVDFDASRSTCPSGTCTYSWSGAFTGTGITVHNATWTGSAPYTVTLTVTDTASNSTGTKTDAGVTPKTLYTNLTPKLTASVSGFTVTVTDATTGNNGAITGDVMWGDGSADGSITAVGGTATYTYTKAGTYIIKYVVTDSAVDSAAVKIAKNTSVRVVVGTTQGFSISGTVENSASAAILNANATLSLLDSTGKVLRRTSANADGTFTFPPVAPGTYTIEAIGNALAGTPPIPTRFTFANVPVTLSNTGTGGSGIVVKAN